MDRGRYLLPIVQALDSMACSSQHRFRKVSCHASTCRKRCDPSEQAASESLLLTACFGPLDLGAGSGQHRFHVYQATTAFAVRLIICSQELYDVLCKLLAT
jgi:hypothetical protein